MPVCLDQRQIPGLSRLYADYLYQFDRVARFYGAATASPFAPGVLAAAARNVSYASGLRARVTAALAAGNRAWGAGSATEELLALLGRPETVVIVTGQQVGLFGGPLLTVYKALTAVLTAERLRAEGVAAVPVFWLASQDHDFAEINQAWILGADGEPRRVELPPPSAPPLSPVGRIVLGPEIGATLDAFAQATGAAPDAIAPLAAAYRPGETLASAFARLLARWFAPWGLIVLDPLDPTLAAAAAPVVQQAVERHEELVAALQQRNRELREAGYHAQVHTDGAALLFLETNGQRQALRFSAGGAQAGAERYSVAQLAALARAEPHRFSPGALLRPLVQDYLLPSAAQVTGPAETAYLAQSSALYAVLGQAPPLRLPRLSATLLDARTRRLLEKYQLTVPEIWGLDTHGDAPAALAAHLARQTVPAGLAANLAAQREAAAQGFAAVGSQVAAVDPSLVDFVRTAGEKVRHQFDQVEAKLARSLARRQEDLARQAHHLVGQLYPQRQLQERLWNSAAAALRLGPLWPALLHDQLQPARPDHQFVDI